ISPQSDLYSLSQTPEWIEHQGAMNESFEQFKHVYQEKMSPWAASELAGPTPDVLFYPFGGPEILIPQILFPRSKEYILFGMEPTGTPPDPLTLGRERLPAAYATIRNALSW